MKQLYEFNPVVYNFKLWITTESDRAHVLSKFRDYYTNNDLGDICERDVVYPVENKANGSYGALIAFYGKNRICLKTVAHEIIHTTSYLLDIIGDTIDGSERTAYLAGWVAECCEQVKTKTK